VRQIATPPVTCREILSSVDHGGPFTAPICQQAAAEPAIDRWVFVQ